MSATDALAALLFLPLLLACALVVWHGRGRAILVVLGLAAPFALLVPVTAAVWDGEAVGHVLGGWQLPLGIRLVADPLAVVMLWLTAAVGGMTGLYALLERTTPAAAGAWFWPLWFLLLAGCNALFLSADLFNLYVALELVTLAAIPLIALAGDATALRAAMRYLLLAMLASLAYLMGVVLLYAAYGTLDIYLLGEMIEDGWAQRAALALITAGLLLKTAIFPLHVWLPPAHSSAPGPVSALLSALVVKASLYLVYRIGMWTGASLDVDGLRLLLGLFGAAAVLYGSLAALTQQRLKLVVAYSTVAQLGYLMLLFPLAGMLAWHGAIYHALSHGLAKAAMFLAAAGLIRASGSDRLDKLAGADRIDPVSVFAFGIAGVSIMGLPPSGGFIAKWTLLQAALAQASYGWLAVLVAGSLLAAAYVLRVMAMVLTRPRRPIPQPPAQAVNAPALVALVLALAAMAMGFTAAPVFDLLDIDAPPGAVGRP